MWRFNFKELAFRPSFWIGLAWAGVFISAMLFGRFEPLSNPDSRSYITTAQAIEQGDFKKALSGQRSLGLPVFLCLSRIFSKDLSLTPHLQLFVLLIALVSLARVTRSRHVPTLITLGLCANFLFPSLAFGPFRFQVLLPGFLVLCLSIFLVAELIKAQPNHFKLGFWVFSLSMVRGEFALLAVFVPLSWYCVQRLESNATSFRSLMALILCTVTPLLLFCSLRKILVGDFGIVSFAGINTAALSTQLIHPSQIPELDFSLRPLAERVIERRKNEGFVRPTVNGRLDFETARRQHNKSAWNVAIPAVFPNVLEAKLIEVTNYVEANAKLMRFSTEVFTHNPALYLQWVGHSFLRSLKIIFVRTRPVLGLLALFSIWGILYLRKKKPSFHCRHLLQLVAAILPILLAQVIAVCFFGTAIVRYFFSAFVWVDSLILVSLFAVSLQIQQTRG